MPLSWKESTSLRTSWSYPTPMSLRTLFLTMSSALMTTMASAWLPNSISMRILLSGMNPGRTLDAW